MFADEEIIDSWHSNASAWIKAIKNEDIQSGNPVSNGGGSIISK
jgi:hypothetical protein